MQFEDGRPVNAVTGKHPNFVHANGKWPISEILHRHDLSLGKADPLELFPVNVPFTSTITIDVCRKCRDRIVTSSMGFIR